MRLLSIQYSEWPDKDNEWSFDAIELGAMNLIVGKNASGKTRFLNVIGALAALLAGKQKELYLSGHWKAVFAIDSSERATYELSIENREVVKETYLRGRKRLLTRGPAGEGSLVAEALNRKLKFQTPPSQIAALSRRDAIQHPYFEDIYLWGVTVKFYRFGSDFGKSKAAIFVAREGETAPKDRTDEDPDLVCGFFNRVLTQHGQKFKDMILNDMSRIGYPSKDVGHQHLPHVQGGITPSVLYVHEADLACRTLQTEMSQGMYRALALIIQVNGSILAGGPQTILIDDIGEGLDFERSRQLISLLMEKTEQNGIQLIMTTNDRFVMNAVPLKYWTILSRDKHKVFGFNAKNSPKPFRDFEYFGLSNFDFFSGELFAETGEH